MLRWNQKTALVISAVALFGYGCFERQLRPVNPCTTSEVGRRISIENVDTVDMLLMVDNSGSMSQEQGLLIREIPRMIEVLASGDRDLDPGTTDDRFTAVRSMHVGVITSDMGGGNIPAGTTVPSCDIGLGDDGIMRNTSTAAGCMATYPSRVFAFERGGATTPMAFGADIGCVANLGTNGCGFEQQLEATLKALSPSVPTDFVSSTYVPPGFFGGTFGHGDGMNAGFLRPDSALAIILLTDEEDCSVPAYELFYMDDPRYAGNNLNLRCSRFDGDGTPTNPGALYPYTRYIDGFAQLRENPSLLIYAPITGIPTELVGLTYEDMLAAPQLTEMEEPGPNPMRLLPSCDTANGVAYPPRRIIEVARGLRDRGASTTVQSICASDFRPAVDVIVAKIADALSGACLPRALNQRADGTVGCDVFELLPAPGGTATVTSCEAADLEYVSTETVERPDMTTIDRELCRVPQVTPADGVGGARGWWYDNTSPEVVMLCSTNETPQRIQFAPSLMPPTGSEVRLNCAQAILPGDATAVAQIGTFCTPFAPSGADNLCPMALHPSGTPGSALDCDPLARACGVTCSTDADCNTAGLLSYVCDTRTILDVVGGDMSRVPDVTGDGTPDPDAQYFHCVNPTCGD